VGYAQRMKLAQSQGIGEDVLVIRMDRRTRHLRIKCPDDIGLALEMLKGAAVAIKKHHDELESKKPKVQAATPGEASALGIKLN